MDLESGWVSSKKSLIILCIGDSLTSGYQSSTGYGYISYHPYTEILGNLLGKKRGILGTDLSVLNKGINGDTTSGMLERFKRDVEVEKPDIVVIWGGINDLYRGCSPEDTMSNLKELFRRCLDIAAEPIACSVTSTQELQSLNEVIRHLNNLIETHCVVKGFMFIDLYEATSDENGNLISSYSDDGIHLSKAGYQRVAETIFAKLENEYSSSVD
jgi:lysophospholipase L1-like esterase